MVLHMENTPNSIYDSHIIIFKKQQACMLATRNIVTYWQSSASERVVLYTCADEL